MRPGPKPKDELHSLKQAVCSMFPAVQQLAHELQKVAPQSQQLLIDDPQLAELIESITPAEEEKRGVQCGGCNEYFARNYHLMRHARNKAKIDPIHAEFVKKVEAEQNRTNEPIKYLDDETLYIPG
ncbi:hypothetical protein BDD12DRAFT_871568 [Trichophaea hybrida]|nr:hypothetical protein BDD12DRAFT_871568 [Trichophaea hybrida]